MKSTGIIRRIDELGRIVIPMELRRTLCIGDRDPIEIFTDDGGIIALRKYSGAIIVSDFLRQLETLVSNEEDIRNKPEMLEKIRELQALLEEG